ncbi:MAG: hydroxyacylglutathione hydrolase [Pseudomonadota bacterium]|jgi:hydroxyacylglutathione hydrolase|uniref:Hydroxyacylglutathione hydrolase n=1 Tax=Pseudaquabacterium rugosum TaxID=2984194 RepID=A0ABU9BBP5_9BURK
MNLAALPAFDDNCIWMLDDGRAAVVVDPGDALPVLDALRQRGLWLAGILVTHHHRDHVGGLDALRPHLRGPLYMPAREPLNEPCAAVSQGDVLPLPLPGLARPHGLRVLDVPGHTAGHVAYVVGHADGADPAPLLFCGDTLFSAGCGRLFEGTPQQMHDSLQSLAALPDATKVCCAHEYTVSNLRFACAVEPDNPDIAAALDDAQRRREQGQLTLPSTIGRERAINPFLRCGQPAVIAAARAQGATDDSAPAVLAALRTWKNRFR